MDINKLELLLKKVNQAVNTIKQLKDREKKYLQVIESLKGENAILKEGGAKLKEENARLSSRVNELTSELSQNEGLQNELEDRIIAMLNSLPDDEGEPDIDVSLEARPPQVQVVEEPATEKSEEPSVTIEEEVIEERIEEPSLNSVEKEEREEEIIKNFLSNSETNDSKGLFKEEVVVEETIPQTLEQPEEQSVGDFNNLLFTDSEQDDVSFDFKAEEVVTEDVELPKGVL